LAGTSLPLSNAAVTVGRAAGSTLVLDDDYASSQHARLVPRDGIWLIEDLGSTNGTYLDGERITEPTPVPAGARIRVGQTSLELQQ
jgi:pSer/pThr/pTyr-binding forkhead associated (FHA) protein